MSSKRATIPIYLQTAEMLSREIAAGRLIEGEKLPPEREMAAQLGIAVGTLRKSLDDLEAKGLLEAATFMDANECKTIIKAGRSATGKSSEEWLKEVETAVQKFGAATHERFKGEGEFGGPRV